MVLVTREDRTKPAVVYSKGSDFYDAYKMELEQGRKLYTHLNSTHVDTLCTPVKGNEPKAETGMRGGQFILTG